MPDLVQWAFRSPGRLAGVVAVLLALVVALSLAARQGEQDAAAREGGRATPSASPTAAAGALPPAGPFVETAVRFVRAWAVLPAGTTPQQWRAGLAPLVTADLARGLALTDPRDLPGAVPAGEPVLKFLAASSALVEVPLADASSVLVTVVDEPTGRRVSDVQPTQGDVGLAPSQDVDAGASPSATPVPEAAP